MPRRARPVVPNIPWHTIQLGKSRSACFEENSDYQYFLETLAVRFIVRSGCSGLPQISRTPGLGGMMKLEAENGKKTIFP